RPGSVTITYSNPGNTDVPAPLLLLEGSNALFQVPGESGFTANSLRLIGSNPAGPFGTLPPGFHGSITVSFRPETAGAGVLSRFSLQTIQNPDQPLAWEDYAAQAVPTGTSPRQWAEMVGAARTVMGETWGDVVSFLTTNTIQLIGNTASPVDAASLGGLQS